MKRIVKNKGTVTSSQPYVDKKPLQSVQKIDNKHPYLQITNRPYDLLRSYSEQVEERNGQVQFIKLVESIILARLEAGGLPKLEERITQAVINKLAAALK